MSAAKKDRSNLPSPFTNANGKCTLCGKRPHTEGFPWMFSCCFQGKLTDLVNNLNVKGDFFVLMQDENVFSLRDVAEIQAEGNVFAQREAVVEKLKMCDDECFFKFLDILNDTNQCQIAKTLEQHFSRVVNETIDLLVRNMKLTEESFYQTNKVCAYPMTANPRGTALIINMFEVANMPRRDGSMADVEALKKLFDKLTFVPKESIDLRAEEIPMRIEDTLEEDVAKGHQCFVLFIMSHGGTDELDREVVYGKDGKPVTKKSILNIVTDYKRYPQLKTIPVLVFFVCCRGKEEKQRIREQKEGVDDQHPNLLCCHSSLKGQVSYLNLTKGTRFVRVFAQAVVDVAHNTDIIGIMKKVEEDMKSIDSDSTFDQRIEYVCDPAMGGSKKLFFFPGITA